MMAYNVDTLGGLTNGGSGTLMKTDVGIHMYLHSRTRPLRVWIMFEKERVGQKLRRKQRFLIERLT
jgi:hypothetical protein